VRIIGVLPRAGLYAARHIGAFDYTPDYAVDVMVRPSCVPILLLEVAHSGSRRRGSRP
jgi:hypothetical protein